jgi:RNA-directed DNA polymerase
MKNYKDIFEKMISLENLFQAWADFKSDKRNKKDVRRFEWKLEQNIFRLHRELRGRTYTHGAYSSFYIQDPKQRHIHKAKVRDRILHHAIFSALNPIFEPTFIPDSFSCRIGKGTHGGVLTLGKMIRKESKNYSRPCFILKCDIKKFFDSVDHEILLRIMNKRVTDPDVRHLLKEIVGSFSSKRFDIFKARGVPIGNLTSQLFANVYMNEFDQFVKHRLKIKHYARYTDDFVIVSHDKEFLSNILEDISRFLEENLALELHPKKVIIRKYRQGVDFLGYVTMPHYRLLRTKTKKRIFKKLKVRIFEHRSGKIDKESLNQCLQSYLGVLSHADTYNLQKDILNQFWFWLSE